MKNGTRKYLAATMSATLLLSSCGSADSGAVAGGFMGAQLGSILGEAIGFISGGPRGGDIGTIVGMAGGAVAGTVIGNAADKSKAESAQGTYVRSKAHNIPDSSYDSGMNYYGDEKTNTTNGTESNGGSGFDPSNSGNDIIDFGKAPADEQTPYSTASANTRAAFADTTRALGKSDLEIRNVVFKDIDNNYSLRRGELAQITMEVYNNTTEPMYNIQPMVKETTGNKHIYVSEPIIVERIAPGKGIRYTAMVKADNKLKEGTACFTVIVRQTTTGKTSEYKEFNITTHK